MWSRMPRDTQVVKLKFEKLLWKEVLPHPNKSFFVWPSTPAGIFITILLVFRILFLFPKRSPWLRPDLLARTARLFWKNVPGGGNGNFFFVYILHLRQTCCIVAVGPFLSNYSVFFPTMLLPSWHSNDIAFLTVLSVSITTEYLHHRCGFVIMIKCGWPSR